MSYVLVAVVYLACFFFGVFPNVWVMAVTFPAFLMIPGATYFAWGKARDIRRKELEQAQAENAGKVSIVQTIFSKKLNRICP